MMQRLFEEGLKSAVTGVKQKRSMLVLSSLFVLVPILVALLAQAPPMQAADFLGREAAPGLEENSEYLAYLPFVMRPPFIVADFNTCDSINNLGGGMGAAYIPPSNIVIETYVERDAEKAPGDCAVHIEYHIKDWGAFWLQLEHADLSEFTKLIFDIQGDETIGVPAQMKIEIKRDCQKVSGSNKCNEIVLYDLTGITKELQREVSVELSAFDPVDWPGYTGIQDWSDIEELVFTFEASSAGEDGAIYLDNIHFGN